MTTSIKLKEVFVLDAGLARTSLTLMHRGLVEQMKLQGVSVIKNPHKKTKKVIASLLDKILPLANVAGSQKSVISPVAWAQDSMLWPYTYCYQWVPWVYDCWGGDFDKWVRFLKRRRVNKAFFTSQDALREIKKRLPRLEAYWCPEACSPELYHPSKQLLERRIDLLEVGRMHEKIHGLLQRDSVSHRINWISHCSQYSKRESDIHDLYLTMGESVCMLCYPKSVTHPELAGGVETMTQRYLEAIASKCIVIGQAPKELIDLFGFNPVVELPERDPIRRMKDILDNKHFFQSHVNKSYERLLEVGTFSARVSFMLSKMS